MLQRSLILLKYFLGLRHEKILAEKQYFIQLIQICAIDRPDISGGIVVASFFAESPFVVGVGDAASGARANPDGAFEPHRRSCRRVNHHYRNLLALERPLLDVEGRERDDVAVASHRGKAQQQLVGDVQADGISAVIDADKEHTRLKMAGQIVGEGADSLANSVSVGECFFALDAVGFHVIEQCQQFVICHGCVLYWVKADTR